MAAATAATMDDQLSPNSASKEETKISSRRLPPPCWNDEETAALIKIYRDKWFALKRGNLRAHHWEEVAAAVRERVSGSGNPKTAVQCRHKMEKLRKRYRSEKRRPHRISWVHFSEMDAMETGSGAPLAREVTTSEEDEDEGDLRVQMGATRVFNGGLKGKPAALMGLRRVMEERERKERQRTVVEEMVEAVKVMGDGFLRVEEMKMEMVREMERMRMEMELRRTEMFVESQRLIVDGFLQGFCQTKKKKIRVSQSSV